MLPDWGTARLSTKTVAEAAPTQDPGSIALIPGTLQSPKEDDVPAPDPPSQASQLPLRLTNNHSLHLAMKEHKSN